MEQQEEKKIKVYKSKRRQSKSASSFPVDLTSEILLRLPEKSAVRFRCVSKLWLKITTDPYFVKAFEARSPRPSLLLCFIEDDELFVSSIPQQHQTLGDWNKSYSSSQPIDRYHMKPPKCNNFPPTESVHGLICFKKSATPVVWNPSTRQFLTLPKPRVSWNDITIFLGYDPVEGKHKVMCIPFQRSCDVSRVLTLGSSTQQQSWRTVKTNHTHRSDYHSSGRCIKGVVYYLAYVYHKRVWVLMSFHVRFEKFDMIQLPSDVQTDVLITYQGKLACLDRFIKNGIRLWLLEDAEEHKWSSKDFLVPLAHHDKSLGAYFILKGFTHAGEFLYVPCMFHTSSCILFCDPVRNTFRRFQLEGITYDNYVLDKDHGYDFHVFPNHVDSQMSL